MSPDETSYERYWSAGSGGGGSGRLTPSAVGLANHGLSRERGGSHVQLAGSGEDLRSRSGSSAGPHSLRTKSMGDLRARAAAAAASSRNNANGAAAAATAVVQNQAPVPSAAAAVKEAYHRANAERERQAKLAQAAGVKIGGDTFQGEGAGPSPLGASAPMSAVSTTPSTMPVASRDSFEDGASAMNRTPSFSWPEGPTTSADLIKTLNHTHDHLISIIAAFIGAVHSHSANDHASSKGRLIEMTRETVDQVRQLLALVDSVMASQEVGQTKPRELLGLEGAKTTLFSFTSSLVDSIRAITSMQSGVDDMGNPVYADENFDEEKEKGKCLSAATGALRASQECLTAVKLCLARRIGEQPFIIDVLPPPSTELSSSASVSDTASYEFVPEDEHGAIHHAAFDDSQAAAIAASFSSGSPPPSVVTSTNLELSPETQFTRATTPSQLLQISDKPEEDDPTMHVPVGPTSNVALKALAAKMQAVPLSASSSTREASTPVAAEFPVSVTQTDTAIDVSSDSLRDEGSELSQAPASDNLAHGGSEGTAVTSSKSSLGTTLSVTVNEDRSPITPMEEKIQRGDLPSVPSADSSIRLNAPITPINGLSPFGSDNDPHAWLLSHDYDVRDISTNTEGLLNGGSLEALVEKMTSHTMPPDPTFAATFMLTFRLFTTPIELLQVVMTRFNTQPPNLTTLAASDLHIWRQRKQVPVRERVCDMLIMWLDEKHWRPDTDREVLPTLLVFARDKIATSPHVEARGQRLVDRIHRRMKDHDDASSTAPSKLSRTRSADLLRTGSHTSDEPPTPRLDKDTLRKIRKGGSVNLHVSEFDILELARQLTIKEARLYGAIKSEELLASGQAGVRTSDSVRAVTTLSTSITGWVTECVLNEADTKKRAKLLKYFITLADRCLLLNNFSTLRAVMAALDSSTISRLAKTWMAVSAKYQIVLENLRKVVDHQRNHAEYRSRLRNCSSTAVPFLGVYLTDIIFCRSGNPAQRASPLDPSRSLLNFHRYTQLARIVQDMQRFQSPYNLLEIDEVQQYLDTQFDELSAKGTDLQELYRRSLLVEPRQPKEAVQNDNRRDLFAWTKLSGFGSNTVTNRNEST